MFGTLSLVALAIWGSLAVDPRQEIVVPFSWISTVLAFLSPFDILADFITSLARLASRSGLLVSGVTFLVLVSVTISLFGYRQHLRKKVTRDALKAWQGLWRHDLEK